ncbi:MAG: hypothetical protein HXN24_08145 [Porphyromonas sp.]|nr:hypothetical protein [Porphyromonas sp.]
MLALLYTFPIGALVLQIVAFMLDSSRIALLALIAPLVFIPQVALYIRAKYNYDIQKVVTHAILSGILTILSSLLMLM